MQLLHEIQTLFPIYLWYRKNQNALLQDKRALLYRVRQQPLAQLLALNIRVVFDTCAWIVYFLHFILSSLSQNYYPKMEFYRIKFTMFVLCSTLSN